MRQILLSKKILRRCIALLLCLAITSISLTSYLQTPFSPTPVYAESNSCIAPATASSGTTSSPTTQAKHLARVGGVALDQAAKFLADMTEVTGAYYDAALDRIVFVGKKNTVAPKFDKDDLAVAIKAIIFKGKLPWVSLEGTNPDPNYVDAIYSDGIENTRFGNVLVQADYKLKLYGVGTNENGQQVASSVSGYQSLGDRYYGLPNITPGNNSSRFWLEPKLITLSKDDAASAFVFETTTMKLRTESENPNNDPKWNQIAQDFADHFTQNYDAFAQENPIFSDAKQLGRIAAVIKWINDSGISTDFHWARDYAPKVVQTPKTFKKLISKQYFLQDGSIYRLTGGADLFTANTYTVDATGASSGLKNSSQSVPTTKEDIHWTFTKDSQQYEAVAVTADAFRSLGSYNASEVDMSFPTAGDLTLAFQRIYSSFSGGQYGVGRGWNIYPASLFDNKPTYPATTFVCTNGAYPKSLAFVSQTGGFESFSINDCNVGYIADDPAFNSQVFRNSDGTFTARLTNQTEFLFDSSYKLTKIKDKNGNTISYNYDGSGKLINIADSKGHQITVSYSGTLISSIADWSGTTVNYAYDAEGNLLTVKDPNNNLTTYTYDSNFKLITITDRNNQIAVTNTYTDEAKIATQKDAANITNTHTYDKVNKKITVTNNQIPSRTQSTQYDSKARILQQADPLLKNRTYTYGTEFPPLTITDKNGNKITNTYDTNGNLTSITYPDTKKVTYQYDTKNRLTKIIDERYGITAKQTTFTYDASNNLTQLNEVSQITNYTYDLSGEMLTLTDPLIHKTTWTRDSFGSRLTEVDALNNTTNFTYDAIARLTKTTDPDLKATSYTYDNNSNLLTQTDAVGTTTNTYDKENRLTKVKLPDNSVSEFIYNASGTLTSTKDQALNLSSYGYDGYQNLTLQTDALNKITTNTYDALNRQTQSTTPLGKIYKYEYDANGNITKRTDANNNITTYQYDAFNRLTKITYPDIKTVTFVYDNRGNRTQMVDSNGTSTYSYDNFDRLTQATNAYGKALIYTYDNADNLKTITYPDSGTVKYAYDSNNRLTSVTDWNSKVTTYTYNKNGALATRLLPNTVKTTYAYDAANRVKTITHTNSALTTLAKYDYTRDPVGNITIATESGSFVGTAQTVKYNYDALGRITKATYPSSKTFDYTYDKVGNRLTQKVDGTTTTSYVYDNDYRLTQKDALTSYTYDNNGNQTKKPSGDFNPNPTFTFDFENRLTAHTTSAGNVYDYKYDGLGNRLRKNMSTAVTRYIFDTSDSLSRLMATSGDQNFATTFWIYGLGLIYDTDSNYYLEDGTGSMRFIANSSGSKRSAANYDPFGNIRSSSGILPDFQFNKQQNDSESNLFFLRARYYDPSIGRFISKDPVKGPLANPQSQNPYAYALNNPVNNSDPSGLFAAGPCISCGGGIGVYGSLSLCAVGTSGGEFGVIGSTGIGGIAGVAASINLLGGMIDFKANKLSDLEGSQTFMGGSIKAGGGAGGDVSFDKKPWEPTSISGGLGPGINLFLLPAEFHGGKSDTKVLLNFNDLFNNLLK